MGKTLLLFLTAIMILSIGSVEAQNADGKLPDGITFRRLFVNYDSPFRGTFTDYQNTTPAVELGYVTPINEYFSLSVPLKVGIARFTESSEQGSGRERMFGSLDAQVQFHFFKGENVFSPYALAGAGATIENRGFNKNSNMHVDLPLGLGLNIRMAPNLYANVQAEYRNSMSDFRNSTNVGFGLLWKFGDIAPPPPPDIDGDGITDAEDDCPAVAGLASLRGCPDADGDGIADKNDDCPDEAGIAKFNGCPDTDEDGIKDSEDKCPEVAGVTAFEGCPDSDGDGLQDSEDDCPNEAGPHDNKGCPLADRDGDGVVDAEDECPDAAGVAALAGCPDMDGDGVKDSDDRCPREAGPKENKGCPPVEKEDEEVLKFAMKSVQFNTARATLKSESMPIMDQIVEIMNKYPKYSLSISGHTDSIGSSTSNQTLSENRAKTCYDYLVSKGIAAERMSYAGYGETQPIADNINKAGREKNRRVEFNIFLK